MSLDKIQQLVSSLAKSLDDNEKIATPILAAKLAKCVDAYPYDQTLGSMSRVIEKMASNNTIFIRKADLKSLYNKLYTRNTKFAELFQDELGVVNSEPVIKKYERDEGTELNNYQVADPVLANALTSVFEGTPLKMYSQALADKALKSVASTLDGWHLRPTSLKIDDGNEKFLMIRADYETPRGVTSFYVPVEITKNKVAEADVFLGNVGPQDLNHTNIKAYITSNAGNKLKANASAILALLTTASSENRGISDAELALTKLNATRQGKSEFFQNQVVGLKVAEASVKDVVLPKYDQFESFEKSWASPTGIAALQFGADKVKVGREHIVRELAGYGHKNTQVTVTGCDDNTIFYAVALDAGRVGFTVPVKLANGKLSKPSVILCNGSVSSFCKEGVNQLYVNNQSDFKVAAAASPLYSLKPSDLITNIKTALYEGNHDKAEDALNVLANAGDDKAYAIGFAVFLQGLGGKTATASAEPTCDKLIKSASSEHPICSHTGLPVHKTYKDKEGNCRPSYRRGMEEGYEAASFMNHKIFG